jgi:hypothetical protein
MTNVISKVIHNWTEYEFNGVNGWVTSVNGNTWAVTVNDVKVSASAPSNPTEWMAWYDTTNDALKVYDGSNWIQTWAVTSVNGNTWAVTVSEFTPSSAGTTDQILTKTANWYDWANAPVSWIQCDPNSPIQIDKIRAGTQSQYDNLWTYSSTTAYLTI